jgi:DNA invertase Pin-like site-specific DNA recombinase
MIQMASVFGEQERSILRNRVIAGLERVRQQGKKLGRPKVSTKVEEAIRAHLMAGNGILKVARTVGCGSGTVQRVKGGDGHSGSHVSAQSENDRSRLILEIAHNLRRRFHIMNQRA